MTHRTNIVSLEGTITLEQAMEIMLNGNAEAHSSNEQEGLRSDIILSSEDRTPGRALISLCLSL